MHTASKIFWGTSLFLSSVSPLAQAQPKDPATTDEAAKPEGPAETPAKAAEPTEAPAKPASPAVAPTTPSAAAPSTPASSPAPPDTAAEPASGAVTADGAAEPANGATTTTSTGTVSASGTAEPAPKGDLFPAPADDAATLAQQGAVGPDAQVPVTPGTPVPAANVFSADHAYAEDWWTHARPILEFHGYLRTRAELFHNFSLERLDSPSSALWARAIDNRFTPEGGSQLGPALCTSDETDATGTTNLLPCDNETQAGANIRLRFNPEIHVSDNLRVMSQIDLLDNLVLGSTPDGYRFRTGGEGQEVVTRSGYNQLGFYDQTQLPPNSSSNSFTDSVAVKRAWGEYTTPVGELRFGRMPDHWGLGMLYNSGDGYDDDYQSTIDRLLVTTGFKSLDLILSASWDFPGEGALGSIQIPGAQPYDRASLDDVNQWSFSIVRKKSEQLEKLALARGDVLLSGGLYFKYRTQTLANDQSQAGSEGDVVPESTPESLAQGFSRREAEAFVPDLWFQLRYKKFRFDLEFASILGTIGSTNTAGDNARDFDDNSQKLKLAQFGLATEIEQKFVEDRLRLNFRFGWASGDPDSLDDGIPGDLVPGANQAQIKDDTDSTFRFHPSYRVDLILNRNILQRVQGTYFFNPGLEYDFIRDANGQRAGGGVQAIWTRASEFVQTPGHESDLGIELNGTVYFQAKDGGLNDSVDTMGGFYSAVQYGVLFPLSGMGYRPEQIQDIGQKAETSAAQVLRMYLGVLF